jgi:hypothetical protein
LAVYDPISKNFISDNQICAGTEKVDSCSGKISQNYVFSCILRFSNLQMFCKVRRDMWCLIERNWFQVIREVQCCPISSDLTPSSESLLLESNAKIQLSRESTPGSTSSSIGSKQIWNKTNRNKKFTCSNCTCSNRLLKNITFGRKY